MNLILTDFYHLLCDPPSLNLFSGPKSHAIVVPRVPILVLVRKRRSLVGQNATLQLIPHAFLESTSSSESLILKRKERLVISLTISRYFQTKIHELTQVEGSILSTLKTRCLYLKTFGQARREIEFVGKTRQNYFVGEHGNHC